MPILGVVARAVAACVVLCASAAAADPVEEFYKGRNVNVYLAAGPGGPHGLFLQTLTPFLEKHIPGGPTIVAQYMPGAGGTRAANYVYNVAPKDGSALGGLLSEMPMSALLRGTGIKYEPNRFNYLAGGEVTSSTLTLMKTAGVATLEEATKKELVIAAGGKGSQTYITPTIANALFGTKFKIVTGYGGLNEIDLAVERGEAHGRAGTWSSIKSGHPAWVAENRLVHLFVISPEKEPDLPDVPLVTAFAKSDEDRSILEVLAANSILGRTWVAPPDVPADRLAALRDGFWKALNDPAFAAEAAKRHIDLRPIRWETLRDATARITALDPKTVARLNDILGFN